MTIDAQFFADLAVTAMILFVGIPFLWIVYHSVLEAWSSMIDDIRSWWS